MSNSDVSSPLDEKSDARKQGEVLAADEEHKHYPTTLESDEEEEDEEDEGETLSSLAAAIERQSNFIKDLTEEIKNLRVEVVQIRRQSHPKKSSKIAKSAKAGKKRRKR